MREPTVDVVIAARNESRHLRECLDALAAQRYPIDRVRVYLVDNGSTDDTVAIAERYPSDKLAVRVLRQTKPGAAAARNAGIAGGEGELLALLDAHCIVNDGWLAAMTAPFADERIGGCQGRIDSRSVSPRIERYLRESGELSNERILDDTVRGKRNLYPWLLSGNSVYRRDAVERAGGFEEGLRACEDVDLAWRIVLLGYHLAYAPRAVAVHHDGNGWHQFLRKGLGYGAGAAMLARMYQPHGAKDKFAPNVAVSASIERTLSAAYYAIGYARGSMRVRRQPHTLPRVREVQPVLDRFRQPFAWTSDAELRVSAQTIFWFRDGDGGATESVIVHVPSRSRVVLTEAGDFIWRRIADGRSRAAIIDAMTEHYGIADATAAADLDELVEELIAAQVVERCRQPASISLGP